MATRPTIVQLGPGPRTTRIILASRESRKRRTVAPRCLPRFVNRSRETVKRAAAAGPELRRPSVEDPAAGLEAYPPVAPAGASAAAGGDPEATGVALAAGGRATVAPGADGVGGKLGAEVGGGGS